ncbi:MAG: hypothetical protein U5K38_05660 [Woeseiaceae bacterium]|nr:hypothetical protein [Woeseiaceae bacterium]
MSYRISDTPITVSSFAPLFPFFIQDHRTHQINPDGTYQSFSNDLQLACEGGQISNDDEFPVDIMLKPQDVSATTTAMSGCSTSTTIAARARGRSIPSRALPSSRRRRWLT